MKKITLISLITLTLIILSCSKSNCKECKDCKTKAATTLCEDDFEKSSDFNDQVDNYVSDGCACNDK